MNDYDTYAEIFDALSTPEIVLLLDADPTWRLPAGTRRPIHRMAQAREAMRVWEIPIRPFERPARKLRAVA